MNRTLKNSLYFVSYLILAFVLNACDGDVLFRTKPCEEGMVRQGSACVSAINASMGECKDVDLNKVQKGETVTMCDGSIGEGKLAIPTECTKDGEFGCAAKSSFKAVDTTKLDATKIANGTTIMGVSGSQYAHKQCRNYSDVANFDSSYPPSNLGFGQTSFAPAAVNTTSEQITFSNAHGLITNSPLRVTSTTTLPAPLVAGTTYYAIFTSDTVIRLASTPNGPQIDLTSQGAGTHTANDAPDNVAQYYDTLEDFNSNQSFSPPNNPWSSSDYLCDATNFVNVTSSSAPFLPSGVTPSTGNQAFSQIWLDQSSGMYISNILYDGVPNNRSWADAIRTCESLNGGTAGDGWHLPTQKELLQLYVNGISKVALAGGSTNSTFWTSTGGSNGGFFSALVVTISRGFLATTNRDLGTSRVICSR